MERTPKKTPLSDFFRVLEKAELVAVGVFLFGIFVVVLIQITGRIIGRPAPWTEEGTRYLFLWMMFVALAAGFNKAESSRVTVFLNIMPRFVQKFSKYLYIVITLGFFAFMLRYGVELVRQQMTMNERGAAILIPMWIIGLCTPVSGLFGILGVIQSIWETPYLIEIDKKEEEKE